MMSPTTNIEVMVDEPIAGHFYWLLVREDGERHPTVEAYAQGPLPSHSAAMMAGIAALQARADSRLTGDAAWPGAASGEPRGGGGRSLPQR